MWKKEKMTTFLCQFFNSLNQVTKKGYFSIRLIEPEANILAEEIINEFNFMVLIKKEVHLVYYGILV